MSIYSKNFQSTTFVILIFYFSKSKSIARHFFLVNEKYNCCLFRFLSSIESNDIRRNFEKTKLIRYVRNVTGYAAIAIGIDFVTGSPGTGGTGIGKENKTIHFS